MQYVVWCVWDANYKFSIFHRTRREWTSALHSVTRLIDRRINYAYFCSIRIRANDKCKYFNLWRAHYRCCIRCKNHQTIPGHLLRDDRNKKKCTKKGNPCKQICANKKQKSKNITNVTSCEPIEGWPIAQLPATGSEIGERAECGIFGKQVFENTLPYYIDVTAECGKKIHSYAIAVEFGWATNITRTYQWICPLRQCKNELMSDTGAQNTHTHCHI